MNFINNDNNYPLLDSPLRQPCLSTFSAPSGILTITAPWELGAVAAGVK